MELNEMSQGYENSEAKRESERVATEIEMGLAGYENLSPDEISKKFDHVTARIAGLSKEAQDLLAENDDLVALLGRVHLKSLPTLH